MECRRRLRVSPNYNTVTAAKINYTCRGTGRITRRIEGVDFLQFIECAMMEAGSNTLRSVVNIACSLRKSACTVGVARGGRGDTNAHGTHIRGLCLLKEHTSYVFFNFYLR